MEHKWIARLPIDPIPKLLGFGDTSLSHFVQNDLLEKPSGSVEELWELAEAKRLVKKQNENGSWRCVEFLRASRHKQDINSLKVLNKEGDMQETRMCKTFLQLCAMGDHPV